jgi:nicotinate dehydrogenase subunit A
VGSVNSADDTGSSQSATHAADWPGTPGAGVEAMNQDIRVTVNGAEQTISCDPEAPLLDVLRYDLGLSGPRFGCGVGLCGACFVLIDGQARSSCDFPAWAAEGKDITTVEGLLDGGTLHAVQRAVIEEQAAQCGYCTSGMIVSAVALLRGNAAPTEDEVRAGLDGNLCRCGAHSRIIRAVLRAAADAAPESAAAPAAGRMAG